MFDYFADGLKLKVNIKREFKYLGVIRASPCDYVQRYGNSLIPSSQLPPIVEDFKTPEGLVLAAHHRANELHELCGDVEALSLIDLEREGLGGYRQYLQHRFGVGAGSGNSSNGVEASSNNNTMRLSNGSRASIAKSTSSAGGGGFGSVQPRPATSKSQKLITTTYVYPESAIYQSNGQQQQQVDASATSKQAATSTTDFMTSAHPIYTTPDQLQMYPNLEQILAQYALAPPPTAATPVVTSASANKSPSVASLRFQAPPPPPSPPAQAATTTAAEQLFDRSVSTTSIGKRSITSVASLANTIAAAAAANNNNGTTYSNSLVETIFR